MRKVTRNPTFSYTFKDSFYNRIAQKMHAQAQKKSMLFLHFVWLSIFIWQWFWKFRYIVYLCIGLRYIGRQYIRQIEYEKQHNSTHRVDLLHTFSTARAYARVWYYAESQLDEQWATDTLGRHTLWRYLQPIGQRVDCLVW